MLAMKRLSTRGIGPRHEAPASFLPSCYDAAESSSPAAIGASIDARAKATPNAGNQTLVRTSRFFFAVWPAVVQMCINLVQMCITFRACRTTVQY